MRNCTNPPLWERRWVFVSFRLFFFHFLPPGRDVCSFFIPSKQAVNALKHEVTCTIMKASVGEPLLPPQAPLLQPGRSLPSSPGSTQAAWSASTHWTFWGPLPSYLDGPPQVQQLVRVTLFFPRMWQHKPKWEDQTHSHALCWVMSPVFLSPWLRAIWGRGLFYFFPSFFCIVFVLRLQHRARHIPHSEASNVQWISRLIN